MSTAAQLLLLEGRAYRRGDYVAIRVVYQKGVCFQVRRHPLVETKAEHILTCVQPQTAVDKVDELGGSQSEPG